MPVVGNTATDYANIRNINGLPFTRYRFRRVVDMCSLANSAYFRLRRRAHPFLLNFHRPLATSGADVLHFFNKVSAGSTPWLSTFETALPRWDSDSEKGLRLMASRHCHRLIGLSEAALQIQRIFLERHPAFRDEIMPKLMVLHPGQQPMIGHIANKQLPNSHLECTLVGNQIFSKGGREAVSTVQQLSAEGYDIRLNIVSGLEPDGYASFTGSADVSDFHRMVEKAGACVRLLGRLPNAQVLDLLRASHISLLPTYADTYGYSVLEAQACACPVISTNIRALPEINADDRGWILPVPKDELGNALMKTREDRVRLFGFVREGIYHALKQALDNPDLIREKGAKALESIRTRHCPEDRARILEAAYDRALGLSKK